MSLKLPRKYLSYSAISLWRKNKEAYRDRYYRNQPSFKTPYTIFGREVHERLESDTDLKHVPRLPVSEQRVLVEVEGIPILGYIDGFCPDTGEFLDYKTSVNEWTNLKVHKLEQLPFYSLLVETKFGKVHPTARVVWLETAWQEPEYIMRGSTRIETSMRKLALTGRHEVFDREIEAWERERMKEMIIKEANEISKDYVKYTKKVRIT